MHIDEKGKFDELVEEVKGVKIVIDPKALMHVIGTKMDFVDDKLRYEYSFLRKQFEVFKLYFFYFGGRIQKGWKMGTEHL